MAGEESRPIIVALISGETVQIRTPTVIMAGYTLVTSLSGGTQLSSGEVVSVRVKNLPGNANMWLGPAGVSSGAGFLLQASEVDRFEIDNLNRAYLFATNSGEFVSYRGVGMA